MDLEYNHEHAAFKKAKEDMIGKKFGRLIVKDYYDKYISPNGYTQLRWLCQCDCGKEVVVHGNSLRRGSTISCGCYRAELPSSRKTHNESLSRLYKIWIGIKTRCNNTNSKSYKSYGERGITICKEWSDNYLLFKEWAYKNGYDDSLTIERIDVNGNYCPDNCKWITKEEQNNNTTRSVLVEYNGEIHNIAQWSKITGIKYSIIRERIFKLGWPVEKALTIPGGAKRGEWKDEQ